MTTRKQIIAAAKEADPGFDGGPDADGTMTDSIVGIDAVKRFYTIVANRVKDECAALCYEQNWELRGEEMSALILATKEEVK